MRTSGDPGPPEQVDPDTGIWRYMGLDRQQRPPRSVRGSGMYNATDITELVRHHLVLAVDNDEIADANLAQLICNIEEVIATPRWSEPHYWVVCENCGASASSELIAANGAREDPDGGFYCTEFRFAGEES